jgi:hypothetical protein
MVFDQLAGLYVYPQSDRIATEAQALVETVAENEKLYTEREKAEARLSRVILQRLGFASNATTAKLLNKGMKNAPVSSTALYRAQKIYGPTSLHSKARPKQLPQQS